MKPRVLDAARRVAIHANLIITKACNTNNYLLSAEYARDHARLRDLIRERDDIALDESDLTPECIGQLMGGN